MAARTPVLDKTDLFGTLPPELLEQLRGRTALARYRRGDTIFEKGEPATHLYVVFSGRIAIVAKAADDRESVLTVLGPGALFGEMSMFDGGVRSANARALTTVHLIAVEFEDVREVLVTTTPETLLVLHSGPDRRDAWRRTLVDSARDADADGRTDRRAFSARFSAGPPSDPRPEV